jgi:predicted GIY-YIG superfamily endonuclease
MLVSFDVVSLFTKIPIQPTLNIIQNRLETDDSWRQNSNLELEDVMELTEICLKSTYFTWRGLYYKQIDGSPMGSPLSPIFADFFMQHLEKSVIPLNPSIKLWVRYVDDVFAKIKKGEQQNILIELNSFHHSIQFTLEEEMNNELAFLDVLIYRHPNGHLGHKVYRKPTHTDEYLKFHSYHHKSQKISVIDSLFNRALRICDKESLQDELDHVTQVLKNNGYPCGLIKSRLLICKTRLKSRSNHNSNRQKDLNPRLILPYIGSLSNRINRVVSKNCKFKTAFIPGRKIETYFTAHKDKRPKNNGGVIYEIQCDTCPQTYIGQTKRDVSTRFKEHLADIKHARTEKSAVAHHVWITGNGNHAIKQNAIKIVEKENRWYHRNFKEALWIQKKGDKVMNQDSGWKINPCWTSLLSPLLKNSTT